MMRFLGTAALLTLISGAAYGQATPSGAGQQVNPGTNQTTGEAGKFGMNNGGDPATGSGLHGGKTADTYEWMKKKEDATKTPAKTK